MGWQMLLGSPRYSQEGRGDPSRRGSRAVLEVPMPEEKNAEPTQRTSVPPIPSSHTTHRLPFGSGKPGRATITLETLWREKRGVTGGLLQPPGAAPTWQHHRAERRGQGPGTGL